MGYADRFYYGQGKLIIQTEKPQVTITDGERSWEVSGSGTLFVPGTNKYLVTAGDDSKEIYVSYGACEKVEI